MSLHGRCYGNDGNDSGCSENPQGSVVKLKQKCLSAACNT